MPKEILTVEIQFLLTLKDKSYCTGLIAPIFGKGFTHKFWPLTIIQWTFPTPRIQNVYSQTYMGTHLHMHK